MTYLQMWKAFNRVCPLRNVRDWRPFGPRQIIVWFTGRRNVKAIKVRIINENVFDIRPTTDEEWMHFKRKEIDDNIFRKECDEC